MYICAGGPAEIYCVSVCAEIGNGAARATMRRTRTEVMAPPPPTPLPPPLTLTGRPHGETRPRRPAGILRSKRLGRGRGQRARRSEPPNSAPPHNPFPHRKLQRPAWAAPKPLRRNRGAQFGRQVGVDKDGRATGAGVDPVDAVLHGKLHAEAVNLRAIVFPCVGVEVVVEKVGEGDAGRLPGRVDDSAEKS